MNLNVCAKNDDEKFFNWDHDPTPVTVCFSEALGYPCCSDPNAAVVTTDEFGQWGIENNQWCGILGSETIVPTLIVITLPILCGIFHTLIMVIST